MSSLQQGRGPEGQSHSHDATHVLLRPTTASNAGHSSASHVVEDNSYVWQGGLLLSTSHPAIAACVHSVPSVPPRCRRRHTRPSGPALAVLSMRRGRPAAFRASPPPTPPGPRESRRQAAHALPGARRAARTVSAPDRRPCVMTHVRTPRREDAGGWKEREWLRRFGLASAVGFCAGCFAFSEGRGASGGAGAAGRLSVSPVGRGQGRGWRQWLPQPRHPRWVRERRGRFLARRCWGRLCPAARRPQALGRWRLLCAF